MSVAADRLPPPDAQALAHSERVLAVVRERIATSGGWIAFADYLQIVLYGPGLGYYVAGARKFGAEGDFVTAPELTPLFGRSLALQVAPILEASGAREIVEIGAGTGRLAADLLDGLAARGFHPGVYRIVELGPELRERQRATLGPAIDRGAIVEWCTALPATIDGAIVVNEVLDAIPAHLVARRAGRWLERGVGRGAGGTLTLVERPLADVRLAGLAQARFPAEGDYASELNPAAEALVEDAGERLRSGAMLILDYGFPRHEFFHPQRCEGTLMGHYRHRSHGDPFLWPGLSDLTTHVDFTAIAEAGTRAGLTVAGFTSQAAFLLGCGLLDRLAEAGEPGTSAYIKATAAVQTLVSPAEMGELFKVMALARSPGIRWPGFALADARHRL